MIYHIPLYEEHMHVPTDSYYFIACFVQDCALLECYHSCSPSGKKGGSLLSAIHSYMQHGDPYVRALVKHILNQVAEPVKIILSRWIYEGELDDAFNEVSSHHFWQLYGFEKCFWGWCSNRLTKTLLSKFEATLILCPVWTWWALLLVLLRVPLPEYGIFNTLQLPINKQECLLFMCNLTNEKQCFFRLKSFGVQLGAGFTKAA